LIGEGGEGRGMGTTEEMLSKTGGEKGGGGRHTKEGVGWLGRAGGVDHYYHHYYYYHSYYYYNYYYYYYYYYYYLWYFCSVVECHVEEHVIIHKFDDYPSSLLLTFSPSTDQSRDVGKRVVMMMMVVVVMVGMMALNQVLVWQRQLLLLLG